MKAAVLTALLASAVTLTAQAKDRVFECNVVRCDQNSVPGRDNAKFLCEIMSSSPYTFTVTDKKAPGRSNPNKMATYSHLSDGERETYEMWYLKWNDTGLDLWMPKALSLKVHLPNLTPGQTGRGYVMRFFSNAHIDHALVHLDCKLK